MRKIYLSIAMLFAVCAANADDTVAPAPVKVAKQEVPWVLVPFQTVKATGDGHVNSVTPKGAENIAWSRSN